MPVDFRLVNALFDCESCARDEYCKEREMLGVGRVCNIRHQGDDCRSYRRNPAYKRGRKTASGSN